MASATLTAWGNSVGLVIPKEIRERCSMRAGTPVEVTVEGSKVVIEARRECTLASLMAGYEGPAPEVIDWGEPVGREIW